MCREAWWKALSRSLFNRRSRTESHRGFRILKASKFVVLPSADAGNRNYSMLRTAQENVAARRAENERFEKGELAKEFAGDTSAADVAWALGQRPAGDYERNPREYLDNALEEAQKKAQVYLGRGSSLG